MIIQMNPLSNQKRISAPSNNGAGNCRDLVKMQLAGLRLLGNPGRWPSALQALNRVVLGVRLNGRFNARLDLVDTMRVDSVRKHHQNQKANFHSKIFIMFESHVPEDEEYC